MYIFGRIVRWVNVHNPQLTVLKNEEHQMSMSKKKTCNCLMMITMISNLCTQVNLQMTKIIHHHHHTLSLTKMLMQMVKENFFNVRNVTEFSRLTKDYGVTRKLCMMVSRMPVISVIIKRPKRVTWPSISRWSMKTQDTPAVFVIIKRHTKPSWGDTWNWNTHSGNILV